MKFFLDTFDLIKIIENSKPYSAQDFEKELRINGHELIVSFTNILEISAPLLKKETTTNVMRRLNLLERMPLKFITSSGIISKLELCEAIKKFSQKKEYQQIAPLVDRFYEILISPPNITRYFLNNSLAEAIFTLWREKPNLFKKLTSQQHEALKIQFDRDRTLESKPSLRENFINKISKDLNLYGLNNPSMRLRSFAEWIYEKPTRCPSVRLGYEVFHNLLKNIGDIPKQGDMGDLSQIDCIPSVDRITLDRRMTHYAKEACKNLGLGYEKRICKNVNEIFK
jgi:hypothetical protein